MSVDHYENFPVASILCPPRLRSPITAIYWFARTADDLADEGEASAADRAHALAAYRSELQAAAAGRPPGPRWPQVFGPLGKAIAQHHLPIQLLDDLIRAFEQDLVQSTYRDRDELLGYCALSANPVGRLLLHLYGVNDAAALRESDAICSALQLINFWQDLGIDSGRGRIYIPLADCERHGVAPSSMLGRQDSPELRRAVETMVRWSRELMAEGERLVHRLPGRAGWELRLVVQGGLRILDKIEQLGFATMLRRPALKAPDAPRMLWRALFMHAPHGQPKSETA